MPLYLGTEDAGTDRFALQDFEPSAGDKLSAATREAWLESYGPVATDWWRARQAQANEPKLSAIEAASIVKDSGIKLKGMPTDGQYTRSQLDVIMGRQRELTAIKDVRERTPWDIGSVLRGGAMFGAGIADPINLATAFVPWTKSLTILNGVRAGLASESLLARSASRFALGAVDGGISTAVLEPLYAAGRSQIGDDYTAMDSIANVAFGTAFGGGVHALGGAAGDLYLSMRGGGSIAPGAVTPNPSIDPIAPPAGAVLGAQTLVRVGEAREPAQFVVVESDTLTATVGKADNQFRDRTRAAYQTEIQKRANNLDPDLVLSTDNPLMDVGTPTISVDGKVIGGNGRMLFIDRAYEIGKGADYRAALETRLQQLGIDPASVQGMKKPVLVRRLQREVDVREAAMASNEGGSTDMSALEQAKVDAERLGDARLNVGQDGDLQAPENRAAIRRWVDAQPENKRNSLVDEDGKLSAEGLRRLNGALLFKAYGDSPTLGRLVESMDPGSRNLAMALGRTAPVIANAREAIASGDLHPIDIAADIQQAVEKFNTLREQGMKIGDYMRQLDAFGDGLTDEARLLLDFMGRNISSPRRIADTINGFYDRLAEAGNPKQDDMFGASPVPDKMAVLDASVRASEATIDSAAEVIAGVAPDTREAALRASVAQSVDGKMVDVDAIVGMDESRQTSTIEDAKAAADKSFEPESSATSDFEASAKVEQRIKDAPKRWDLQEAEAAAAEADVALNDTVKAGDQAFKYAREKQAEIRDLFVQHNLTAENLLFAERMGGIAVPSLAVTKADAPMTNFGEITLLGNRTLIDPQGYAGTKVFGADIYSPRYPQFEYKPGKESLARLNEALAPYRQDGDRPLYSDEVQSIDNLVQNKTLQRMVGEQLGKDPNTVSFSELKAAAQKMLQESGAEEKIFQGYTYSGNRKYTPHTLENVVKILKKELRGGENYNYGVGSLRAKFTPQFKSVKAIKGASDRLVDSATFEAVKQEVNDELFMIADELKPYHGASDRFGFADTVTMTMSDSATMGLPRALKENGFDDVPVEIQQSMAEYLTRLRNLPTEYFEAKILRSVGLGEFAGAVVPDNVNPEVLAALEKRGVTDVRAYKAGDQAARAEAIRSFDDLMFSRAGENPAPFTDPVQLTEAIRQSFGESTDGLLQAGGIRVVATPDDIPGGPHPGDVKGATAPDGTVYMVAQNVSASEARGMVLHEVGVHVGMERMLGKEAFGQVLNELDAAITAGHEWAQAARAAVPANTPANLVREEQLAYLVQNAPDLPIVQKIIAAVRAWAYRTFEFARNNLTLTEGDYQALAISALHAVARGDMAAGLMPATAFSKAGPDIGATMAARIEQDFEAAQAEYAALASDDFNTEGGRVLNTDLARELSPEYRADRTRSADVHEAASAFVKRLYAEKLAKTTPEGRENLVLFTGGGTGAGKSTGMKKMPGLADSAEMIYDTNMNSLASAETKIQQALDAGRQVAIMFTYRDPIEALTGGALPRAERIGRTVPLREHGRTHEGSRQVIDQLAAKYADNERVTILAIDNSRGRGNAAVVPVAEIPSVKYDDLEGKLYDAAKTEYDAGRISEATYAGTTGKAAGVGSDAQGMGAEAGRGSGGESAQADGSQGIVRYSRGETPEPPKPADELKPFDERVTRAKQYPAVLRAAADKLENDALSTEAMRAAMPDITDAEITDLLDQLRKQVKGLRGVARDARSRLSAEDTVNNLQDEAMQAADQLANNIQKAAVIDKRNAMLNLNARMKAASFINQFRNNPKLDVEGFRALLVGTERKRGGGRLSVDAEQKNFRGEWIGGLQADMTKAGQWDAFISGKFDEDVYIALDRMASDSPDMKGLTPEAVQIAEVVSKYQLDARNTRNRFGAWIRDLKGYITRQSHDMYKIRDAGEKAWKEKTLPLLDVARTLRDFNGTMDDFLTRTYDDFATGSHIKAIAGEDDLPVTSNGSSLAKRESASRVLYFKDGASAYAYNRDFGTGRLADAVLHGLEKSAQSAGLLKVLGTNPELTVTRLFDEYAESLRGDPIRRSKFLQAKKEVLENLLGQVDGSVNVPGNVTAAKVGAFLRGWQSMAKLGGALISSVTDLSNYAAELRFGQNKNLLSGTLDGIGALVQGRAKGEKAEVLASLGVFHESMLGSVYHRFDSPDLVGGKMSAAMQLFFKANGLTWWTESLRDGYALQHSNYLASNAGKAFDKLPDGLRDMLGLYNIDGGKWDILRMATMQEADGRKYMTPQALKTVPIAALENYILSVGRTVSDAAILNLNDDLASALRTMTIDRTHHAVIEPNARVRAFMLRGTQPGTVPGEMLRYIGQFKSFPTAMIQMALGREVYGRGYDTLGDYLKNGKGDMLGLATFIGLSTMMGYAAMSVKDMLRGKNPRPVDDPRTWAAAMVQGGGLGIYGDFLFNKYNRMGGTLSGSMGGPVVNLADTAADLWTRIRTGEDFGAVAFNAALQNTPFMSLFYTRVALDYLVIYRMQEAMNPGFLRRMEKRAERENGQTFYLPPTQVVR